MIVMVSKQEELCNRCLQVKIR